MNNLKIAKNLLKLAKQLLSSGTVKIHDGVKNTIDKIAKQYEEEKISELEDSDFNKENKFIREHWESRFEIAIREANKKLQNDLKKESKELLNLIEKAISDKKQEDIEELSDFLFERYRWYIKNDKHDIKNIDNETGYMDYRKVIRGLQEYVESLTKSKESIEKEIKDTKIFFKKQEDKIIESLEKFSNHLNPIAKEINKNLIVNTTINKETLYSDEIDLNFSVDFENSDLGISVFPENGKYHVDDIIDDSDFFEKPDDRSSYESLIHYLRTGQLPKEKPIKFIKLYRAMSNIEYRKWQSGQDIPINKYFTSKNTGEYASDFLDLEKELEKNEDFSHGVENFRVRSDCVSEYDTNIFMTNKVCVLKDPNYIIPKE